MGNNRPAITLFTDLCYNDCIIMSQGKAFTNEERDIILESLRPYLELGFSRSKACKMVGLNESTLSRWVTADEVLGMRLEGWENSINKLVMSNLIDALNAEAADQDDKRKETSKWWAERKMKEDFSQKVEQELSNPDGNLKTIVINKHASNNQSPT